MTETYLYVIKVQTNDKKGYLYRIQGDDVESRTKKGCEKRIRTLCNAGRMDNYTRNYLLKNLREI